MEETEKGRIRSALVELEAELKLRGFSERTVSTYLFQNLQFLNSAGKLPHEISSSDIKGYLGMLISRKNSTSTVALAKASLKFYYDSILKKGIVDFKTPKIRKKLPVVLSKDEVKALITSAKNEKSRLIIELLYSSGLRVSECTSLKIKDIEEKEKLGWVRNGKGGKDRLFILSERLVSELKHYIYKKKPKEYLFEGKNGRLTSRDIQGIIKRSAKIAQIPKKVTPHTLRHSFATHLLEAGVDIRKIQELLGHANLQTTQIYTSVSNTELMKVKSPLDDMKF
ncbi:MAG: tyrosine-type recombinase/integrase [Candidatus Woesearchaeota archaeon]|nr:tyrosine-type recombinase/integrase [Candidatus Woesearchaeota archaeon]